LVRDAINRNDDTVGTLALLPRFDPPGDVEAKCVVPQHRTGDAQGSSL
jgi:hypothetical protein